MHKFYTVSILLLLISNIGFAQSLAKKVNLWKSNKPLISLKENTSSNQNYHLPISNFSKINQEHFFKTEFTLFLVINTQSDTNDPKTILKVFNLDNASISVEVSDRDVKLNSDASKSEIKHSSQGTIIKIQHNNPQQKKGLLRFEAFEKLTQEMDIYEIIFSTSKLNQLDNLIIESYLSLKYGISNKNEYLSLNRKDTLLHKSKEMSGFNHNIFALGKDSLMGLNQKQANYSQSKLLSIGLNAIENLNHENESVLQNGNFIFVGDNNADTKLEWDNTHKQALMDRQWKIYLKDIPLELIKKQKLVIKLDTKPVQTRFEVNNENFGDYKLFYQMNLADKEKVQITADSMDTDKNIFYSISFEETDLEEQLYFSFAESKDLYFEYKHKPECANDVNEHQLNLSVIRGSAPYHIEITDENNTSLYKAEFLENEFEVVYNTDLSHTIHIVDANQFTSESTIEYEFVKMKDLLYDKLQPELNQENRARLNLKNILPPILIDYFNFTWHDENKNLLNNSLSINSRENFSLKATDDFPCECILDFNVQKSIAESLKVYPNPALASTEFTVSLENIIDKSNHFEVEIFSPTGQYINSFNLNKNNQFNAKQILDSPGVYTISINNNKDHFQGKIIVSVSKKTSVFRLFFLL